MSDPREPTPGTPERERRGSERPADDPTRARIFVAIASYRDPECQHTVRDLFAKAAHPERVTVGLCWQFMSPEDDHCFAIQTRPEQVRCASFDARGTPGAGWAKRVAHDLRTDEDYVLQIDSHMRFHWGWDDDLLRVLRECPGERSLISTYPAAYTLPDELTCSTPHIAVARFDHDRLLHFIAHMHPIEQPRRGAVISGGYVFAPARFFDEVPYDPAVYFIGEEVSFSARAFTHGWDVYSPHACLVHHLYIREGAAKHWEDNPGWITSHRRSAARVRHLLGTEASDDPEVLRGISPGEPFALGTARTLAEYERFLGVNFRARTISDRARLGEYGE